MNDEQTDAIAVGTRSGTHIQSERPSIDPAEHQRMIDYVEKRIDPRIVRKTIATGHNEIVDCVDKRFQHGYDRPIETFASPPDILVANEVRPENVPLQGYHLAPEQCPDGTIPQVRISLETLENFSTLDDFLYKAPPSNGPTDSHQYATYAQNVSNWGASSVINYWNPFVDYASEFSLSQIWVAGGTGANLQTVEAGWQVYKNKYGDWQDHLFIYSTSANYAAGSGCYNLDCSAFVQTSSYVALGGYFPSSSMSTYGGTQSEVQHMLARDSYGNWWFQWNGTNIGYYPSSRYASTGILVAASTVQYGGEIVDDEVGGQHTSTHMGNGISPPVSPSSYSYTAYHRGLQYVYPGGSTAYHASGSTQESPSDLVWNCYTSDQYAVSGGYRWFYFGGAGRNGTDCQ